ncbi:hypothetical protein [Sandarakinorhabdus rubra]|uniref:hypothetical protein n=1 Tax=Sandarakinorhabdus rubra TaxID=2672568 RepID=UPI0013DA981E|nr:hypothetical protein [Sandarakinorhabdus rubra]
MPDWTNKADADSFDAFVASAHETKGSWWSDWLAWVALRSGEKVKARVPGKGP